MSEMLDVAARAIKDETDTFQMPVEFYVKHEAQRRWEQANPDGDWYEQHRRSDELESYRIIARAVLAAIREPTKQMLDAAWDNTPMAADADEFAVVWRAMIDAALSEPAKELA